MAFTPAKRDPEGERPGSNGAGSPQAPRVQQRHGETRRQEVEARFYDRYYSGMTARKGRLTVTVDSNLIDAGNQAVAAGLADSLSAWVNSALVARTVQDRRLRSLAQAVDDYEGQYGEITAEEITSQQRADREAAVVVRGRLGKNSSVTSTRDDGAA